MKIVSISMKDEVFGELEKLQNDLGFKGRSDILRRGMLSLKEDARTMSKLKGHIDCVMIIMHSKSEKNLSKVLHKNDDIIKSQLHSKLCNNKCIETFLIHGNAESIKDLYREIKKINGIDYMKLLVP